MKKIISAFILIISLMILVSCEKNETVIHKNFLKQGAANADNLKGTWQFESFGYTADGNLILPKTPIENGEYMEVSDTLNRLMIKCINSICYDYYIDVPNNIRFSMRGSTYVYVKEDSPEAKITNAFDKISSFMIKDNKLYFYYPKIDKQNVLILSRK